MRSHELLFEDAHIIAANKQAPISTQVHESGSLAQRIREEHEMGDKLSLYGVHRLDIPVTGVVVYARTREAAASMGAFFSNGTVRKRYWAAVSASPGTTEGSLEHYILHDRRMNKAICSDSFREGSRFCRTGYRIFGRSERYWFLELEPETGRTHQLRAQLAATGCPIKGDQKYGARRGNRNRLIHLHAFSLAFPHPAGGTPVQIDAEPPDDPVWTAAIEAYRRFSDQ